MSPARARILREAWAEAEALAGEREWAARERSRLRGLAAPGPNSRRAKRRARRGVAK